MRVLYAALVMCLAAPLFLRAADILVMEEIVAKVNGEIVTNADIRADQKLYEDDFQQRGLKGAELESARKQAYEEALAHRIDDILMKQKGKDLNIKIEPEVNKFIANLQRQQNITDPDEFQRLVTRETGRSYEDWKSQLTDRQLVQAVQEDEILRKIQIPKEELRAYYDAHKSELVRKEQVLLREILVSTKGKTSKDDLDAAEAKAKSLAARGQRGEAFNQMAQNNSDSDTREAGGALEPFTKDALNPVIVAAVWDKPAGSVTDPLKFDNGWEIFKIEEHQSEGLATYEQAEPGIQQLLFNERAGPAVRAYLTKLRETAFLQIKGGYSDTFASPSKDTTWADVLQLKPETISRENVLAAPSMKRLLGMIPIPGTEKTGASSSR